VDAGHREGWRGYYVVVGSVVFGLILFFSFRSHVQAAFALRRTRSATCIRQGSEQGCFGFGDSDFGFGGSAAPRVSLVIPSFNEEAVLRQTIPSVLALDYPAEAIELVYIYESASADRTARVIEAFARNDARIRPIRRETTKGGKAPITNDGIRQAAGEIIGIFDADGVLKAQPVRH